MPDLPALLDLHIRLRRRIAAVLHARQHWALLLRDALHAPQPPGDPAFIAAAYDALAAIESPCNIIFDYPLPVPPRADLRIARPAPRQKQINARHPTFLYIKSSALGHTKDSDELYLLRCPQCLRTAFTTLQGLLNHARIAHHLEWGTHEECVRACAVVDPNLDTSAGVEVGLGPAGILPGLRSIFQMAVGPQANQSSDHVFNEQPDRVTKMLGLHQDTPALAPFLGKNPVRRGIKVYGQDDIIDMDSLQLLDAAHPLPLCSRNARRIHEWEQEFQVNDVSASLENVPAVSQPSASATTLLDSTRSRFHFNTRIVITDRSFWIPLNCREEPYQDHTHKWMVSVHSPSYAFDLTTILNSITVTPTHGMDSTVSTLFSAEAPPYVVVGTAKFSFLARIELLFNGIGEAESPISDAQRIVVEHWVELDPLKTSTPVIGEEQTIDIELDKRTVIGPARTSSIPVKVFWDAKATTTGSIANEGQDPASEYTQMLDKLVSSFPMIRESRTARPPDVPYRLVQTHSQLRSLNLGRRKAIEWRRANALRDAYMKAISGYNYGRFPSLSTGDIYTWLADNDHFLRPSTSTAQKLSPTSNISSDPQGVQYCPVCGLVADAHTPRSDADHQSNQFRWDIRCSVKTRRFPSIDSKDLITKQILSPICTAIMSPPDTHSLSQVSDPSAMQAVQAMVENLRLPMFYPRNAFPNETRMAIGTELAPYALLSITMQLFVRALVQGGLEMLRRDMALAPNTCDKTKRDARRIGMLTPAHIFDGIVARKDTIFNCLAHVGA